MNIIAQKKLFEKKEKDARPMTLHEYFQEYIDDERIRLFRACPGGDFTASTPKRPARGTFLFPRQGLGDTTNLKFLDDFHFYIVAVPRELIEEIQEEKKNNGTESEQTEED